MRVALELDRLLGERGKPTTIVRRQRLRAEQRDKLSRQPAINNSNRRGEVSYVAPLSEDIDLK
jgi:hypothetical protein